jgi:hypothetical protein
MTEFRWSPGIGDPTFFGWLTVALYLVTAYACWRVARQLRSANRDDRSETAVWAAVAMMFVALGINKQLDLQTA